MGKTYVTYQSSVEHPLKVRFTCPVCGAQNVCDHAFKTKASETYSGSLHYDSREAEYAKLGAEAKAMAREEAEFLAYEYAHGRKILGASSRSSLSEIVCTKCGTAQVPECCKDIKSFGSRKGCLTGFLIWAVLAIGVIVSLVTWVNSGTAAALLLLGLCAGSALIVVLNVRRERKRTRQAIRDPKAMKEYYGAALNDNIEFDFTEYGLGVIRAGQDKIEGKIVDYFSVSGIYIDPGAKQRDNENWYISNETPQYLNLERKFLSLPKRVLLTEIAAVDAVDVRGGKAINSIRVTTKSGETHTLYFGNEKQAQLAVSKLMPLWQSANHLD